jgi:hypothetical protein
VVGIVVAERSGKIDGFRSLGVLRLGAIRRKSERHGTRGSGEKLSSLKNPFLRHAATSDLDCPKAGIVTRQKIEPCSHSQGAPADSVDFAAQNAGTAHEKPTVRLTLTARG